MSSIQAVGVQAPIPALAHNSIPVPGAAAPGPLPGLPPPTPAGAAAPAPMAPYAALRRPGTEPAPRLTYGARAFDAITNVAGTPWAFGATLAGLLGWGIAGIPLKASDNWQIVMQIASSIQCYASDTLLMRQQRNELTQVAPMLGTLQASNVTKARLLPTVVADPALLRNHAGLQETAAAAAADTDVELGTVSLPRLSWLDKPADTVSNFVGSPWALGLFTAGVGVWLGVGPSHHFNDEWQLDINTAVAVQLTFMNMFLQNTRRRHMNWVTRAHEAIEGVDSRLEARLRAATGDITPNVAIKTAPPRPGVGTRAIDAYANLVASGVGAGVSAAVFGTWLGLGKAMHFSSNWLLIIGTYTGLAGFFDWFVLRNVYRRSTEHLENLVKTLKISDEALLTSAGQTPPAATPAPNLGLWYGASSALSRVLATPQSVLLALTSVGGLLAVATFGFRWNETGQLICNTPTMIAEGFFLHLLMQAHNEAHAERRRGLHDMLARRQALTQRLDALEAGAAGSMAASA